MHSPDALQKLARLDDLERRSRLIQVFLLILLVIVFVAPVAAALWLRTQYPAISTISFDNLQTVGPTALCPGEALVVEYDFHAGGSGVLVRDATVWSVEPPRTIIFSTSRRFILEGPIEQHLTEAWHVPDSYIDPSTDQTAPLPPGKYKRIVAISSPSASRIVAIGSVEFSIREDCQ
jgi:hypothetical protein